MQYFGFDRPSFALRTLGFGANFDPLTLFTGGKQGVWYDPSDKSTLFQDVAGTIPVTKDGDPIGLMKDKSGNGYHATQPVSTARPLYKTDGVLSWFDTDGMDDCFKTNYTPSADWSSSVAIVPNGTISAFIFESYLSAANNYISKEGTYIQILSAPTSSGVSPSTVVLGKPSVVSASAVGDNIGTVPLTIAARHTGTATSFYFSGGMFGLIVINGISSASEITVVEQYLANKSGVTL